MQCYQRTSTDPVAWTLIGDKAQSIDACAGYLEGIRTEKLKAQEVIGGYQGWYVIARPDGIYFTRNLKKFPVRALIQTSNGQLAPPGLVDVCYAGQGANQRVVAPRLKLGACAEALFDKLCLPPGEARYGSWSGTTLRLLDGRLAQAGRDQVFRDQVSQQMPGCRLPIAD
jgi:hypothetical protein